MKKSALPYITAFAIPLLLASCGGGGGGGGGGAEPGSEPGAGQSGGGDLPAVSWYSAARPLVQRYCVSCHREGGTAPFALETYEQVLSKRSALAYVLESGTMPPLGYAGPDAGETAILLDWARAGAPRGDPSQAPLIGLAGGYTYHADVRPLLERYCGSCHVKGGIAPFPLENFEEVRGVSAAIAHAVSQGTMPPWPPTEGYTPIDRPRLLEPEQKYKLLTWLSSDMPEGNPADYRPLPAGDGQPAPEYDISLRLPQPYTPLLQPDDHRCFAIPWPLDEATFVTDVDVLPDQVDEVHHVIVSIAEPEDAPVYYAADGEDGYPGWYCLGAGGVSGAALPRQIGGWVPGAGREPTPEGTGIPVRPGSVLVVQMHYNTLVSEPAPDQSTVLIRTATDVDRPASSFLATDPGFLREGGMPIPANAPDVRHEFSAPAWALALIFGDNAGVSRTEPWVFHQTLLHMHNLGRSGRITLIRGNGTRQVLLDVRDWDFNWQGTYRFAREVLVQPEDRILLQCQWDNSQANQPFVDGVQLKSRYVEWGDNTQDEMCVMSVYMTRPREGYDYSYGPGVHIEAPAYRQRFRPGDVVPLRLLLNNFTLHDPGAHSQAEPAAHPGDGHDDASGDHSGVYSGHYHVYLDSADDAAEHLTAWDDEYYLQLPDDIGAGPHELRVSLRGPDHHALGVEDRVSIEIVEGDGGQPASLVDVNAWQYRRASNDSLASHRPAEVDCQANSWHEEEGALEVETGYCNYLSLEQPSRVAVRPGDQLRLVLWHGDLVFDEPATAHVALSLAGELLWETEVDIPAEAQIYDVTIPVDLDAPEGSEVEYHLHNHGYNTWTLLKLEKLP